MRRVLLVGMLLAGLVAASPSPASASFSVGVSVNYFHDALSPYGEWVRSDRFGLVWSPQRVARDWRPYMYGHWVYTDYDWTWVSDDDWGWATDHYGRWYLDPRMGWVWVPGDEWAPAWVAWRSGGDYVGWAPLPPDVDVFHGRVDYRIDPFAYCFVETRHAFEPQVYRHAVPVARNVTIVNVTQNITNYTVVDNRIVNRGADIRHVEHSLGHAVARVQLREATSVTEARGARVDRGQVAVFRPRFESHGDDARRRAQGRDDDRVAPAHPERREAERHEVHGHADPRQAERVSQERLDRERGDRERLERDQRERQETNLRAQAERDRREREHQVQLDRQERSQEARGHDRPTLDRDAVNRRQTGHQVAQRQATEQQAADRQAVDRDRRASDAPSTQPNTPERTKDSKAKKAPRPPVDDPHRPGR